MGKSLNYEEVYDYVYKNNFILISDEYLGCKNKIILQDFLGYYYYVPFDNFRTNKNLAKFHKSNPYTIQNIKLWCKLNNKSFELISDIFEHAKNKLKWRCLIKECNEVFESNWSDILHNSVGCPFCAGKQVGLFNCLVNKNPELAKEWHPTKNGDLTPYDVTVNSGKKIWWQCSKNPKHEWEASIYNRNNERGCPYCVGKLPSKDYNLLICNPELCKEWDYEKNDKNPEEYTPSSASKVWWKCNKNLKHKWKSRICNRSKGKGCPYCSGRYATEENNLLVNNPTLCEEWSYKNDKKPEEYCPYSNQKVWWKCNECGYEWKISINVRNGKKKHGCPECNKSKGEKKIAEIFNFKNLSYIPQKTFEGLIGLGGGLLSYDFYLPDYNLLVEYQGEQHEKPVDFKGLGLKYAKQQFETQQEHDKRKREYAQKHNIKLLEIWYWDYDNIEEILNKEFIILLKGNFNNII